MVLCFLITDQPPEKRAQIREEEGTVTLLILLPQNIIVFVGNATYLFVIDIVVVIFNSFMLFLLFTFLSKLKA